MFTFYTYVRLIIYFILIYKPHARHSLLHHASFVGLPPQQVAKMFRVCAKVEDGKGRVFERVSPRDVKFQALQIHDTGAYRATPPYRLAQPIRAAFVFVKRATDLKVIVLPVVTEERFHRVHRAAPAEHFLASPR